MLPSKNALEAQLRKSFPFEPTPGQARAFGKLADFLLSRVGRQVFLLKGYAGTGKTTLVQTLVKAVPSLGMKVVLLAPTGRAAKVLGGYTGQTAFTIHKAIYTLKRNSGGSPTFGLRVNKSSNTLFIVDEASMISDYSGESGLFGGNSLLEDLITFVQAGVGCKLMLMGDVAQLPPVHVEESPALDVAVLTGRYDREVVFTELTDVTRQSFDSGILMNATRLRQNQIQTPDIPPLLITGPEVNYLKDGYDIEDALNRAYDDGRDQVMVIVRSNKRANAYNRQIRARVHWKEDKIATGDLMMVVKNNYHWLPAKSKAGFIANGDVIEILELRNHQEMYGFNFVDAKIKLVDYPDENPLDVKLLLDAIDTEGPSLTYDQSRLLFQRVSEDYADEPVKWKRITQIKNNPYLNALQVKFAYAVTCHKAQGGQWKHVFVEQSYLPDGRVDLNYLRWLYTAFTRAQEKIYLIGFPEDWIRE